MKGEVVASDGWTFEYAFARQMPRTIVVRNEVGKEDWRLDFHYRATLTVLSSYARAFMKRHPGPFQCPDALLEFWERERGEAERKKRFWEQHA